MVKIDMPFPQTCSDCMIEYDYDSGYSHHCPLSYDQFVFGSDGVTEDVRRTQRLPNCPLKEGVE